VLLVLDHPRREALLEEMALAPVSAVEALRVDADQPVHRGGELPLGALRDHVEVRTHHAPRVQADTEQPRGLLEQVDERCAVDVVEEDCDAAGTARGDVVEAVGKVAARSAWHVIDGRALPICAPALGTVS
jgi:hypothetical protein